MNHRFSLAVLLSLGLGSLAYATDAPPLAQHEIKQQQRIEQGLQSGQLTPHEAAVLHHQDQRADRMRARARADGKVTPAERQRLKRAEQRQNQRIWQLKHNRVQQ